MLNALQRDLSYAIRRLWREPAFTFAAVLILAVGIGSSTAMFSIVRAVLLRPFGVQSPSRVVMMWPGDSHHDSVGEFPFAIVRDMRNGVRSFTDVALVGSVNWWGTIMMPEGTPLGLSASAVSATFFNVLGARPLLGRTFRPEDEPAGAPRGIHRPTGRARRMKSEPNFHQLEPHGSLAAGCRLPPARCVNGPTAQARRARTPWRSAVLNRPVRSVGSVTTAPVFPVVSKNSTE